MNRIHVEKKLQMYVGKYMLEFIAMSYDVLTHHFWWYMSHTTTPHKLSTSLEGDPKYFRHYFVKQVQIIKSDKSKTLTVYEILE